MHHNVRKQGSSLQSLAGGMSDSNVYLSFGDTVLGVAANILAQSPL